MDANLHIPSEYLHSLNLEGKDEGDSDRSLVTDLMNGAQICFSCEQIFSSRTFLEEHVCPSAGFICSCGTEFTDYKTMHDHSTTHQPGTHLIDHETIKKRRIEKRLEEEEKLKRLHTGEVVWEAPKPNRVPAITLAAEPKLQAPTTSGYKPQFPKQSALASKVPGLYSSSPQASLLPNPALPGAGMQNVLAGAPTVDLWTLYHPVVLLQTMPEYKKKKPYTCGKCDQSFVSKVDLVAHFNLHVADKISGCVGCGMLLSSKKLVPRFHACHLPNSTAKFKVITAKPLSYKSPKKSSINMRPMLMAQGSRPASSVPMRKQNNNAKGTLAFNIASALKNQNTYNAKNQIINGVPPLQFNGGQFFPSQHLNPSTPSRSSPVQLQKNINSALGTLNKPAGSSSAQNEFTCRVCYISFLSPQLLQRHKCIKAREFMARHIRGAKQFYKVKSPAPVGGPIAAQMNGERKPGVPPSDSIKIQAMAAGKVASGSDEVERDDDCYIVEDGPEKTAEMIYQVTSSVPIKI
ncbi:uncharacterized protein KZ484_025704 isoform 1-T2 [Pholidichthys leucotaenia]